MSVLNFFAYGGTSMTYGTDDVEDANRRTLESIAKTFATALLKSAREREVPMGSIPAWKANYALIAVDSAEIYFVLVDLPGMPSIRYRDLTTVGHVGIAALEEAAAREIGTVEFSFSLPIHALIAQEQAYLAEIEQAADRAIPSTKVVDDTLCFVIMSFGRDPQLIDFYEKAVKPTVEGLGFRCERVDEQEFNGSIKQRILENIRLAKFIVADMTGARPNCYYELGVAHSMGKEVVHLARESRAIHFDVNDFNFIIYSRIDELAARLKQRITGTILK